MASNAQYDQGSGQPRPLQMGAKGAYIVRLLMVGDSSCGKTSLVLRFDQNVFSTKFVTTIGVDYRDKMVKVRAVEAECVLCVLRLHDALWRAFRRFFWCPFFLGESIGSRSSDTNSFSWDFFAMSVKSFGIASIQNSRRVVAVLWV